MFCSGHHSCGLGELQEGWPVSVNWFPAAKAPLLILCLAHVIREGLTTDAVCLKCREQASSWQMSGDRAGVGTTTNFLTLLQSLVTLAAPWALPLEAGEPRAGRSWLRAEGSAGVQGGCLAWLAPPDLTLQWAEVRPG